MSSEIIIDNYHSFKPHGMCPICKKWTPYKIISKTKKHIFYSYKKCESCGGLKFLHKIDIREVFKNV